MTLIEEYSLGCWTRPSQKKVRMGLFYLKLFSNQIQGWRGRRWNKILHPNVTSLVCLKLEQMVHIISDQKDSNIKWIIYIWIQTLCHSNSEYSKLDIFYGYSMKIYISDTWHYLCPLQVWEKITIYVFVLLYIRLHPKSISNKSPIQPLILIKQNYWGR
jgi:hypothetical protein